MHQRLHANHGNGRPQCCGDCPTLRVATAEQYGVQIPCVIYECRHCKFRGSPGLTIQEAAVFWDHALDGAGRVLQPLAD